MSMHVDKSSTLSGQKLSLSEAAGRKCVQNNMGKGTPAVSLRQPSILAGNSVRNNVGSN